MNNFPFKNYPFDADSPYQKQRKRFKTLITLLSGSGHIVERRTYELNQKFNHWEKAHPASWSEKPIQQFNARLQNVLDNTLSELNELEKDIDEHINSNPKPTPPQPKRKGKK